MKFTLSALLVLMLIAFGPETLAHDFWINCTDHYVVTTEGEFGSAKVYFGYGHRFPVDDFLKSEKLASFELIDPAGNRETLKALSGGFTAAEIEFGKQGAHIVIANTHAGYYTMYIDKGKMSHSSSPMKGKENIVVSVYFENYAKCLIIVGNEKDDAFKKPVGHNIEIVPLTDPRDLKVGDLFEFRVLFDGKPASFATVEGSYCGFSSGEDMAYSTGTGINGRAAIRILHWGPQILKAQVERPPQGEHVGNCQYEVYSASFTFEVK